MSLSRTLRAALPAALAFAPAALHAQARDTSLTVPRIYASSELSGARMPNPAWLKDGHSYVELRRAAAGGTDLVKVDVATGASTVLAPASAMTGADGKPIRVERFELSDDESKALLFHNSVRVWRQNTRGVYDVLDLRTLKLTPVSKSAGLQMFAKFSPDGGRVAFVRDNNLFVSDLASGAERAITHDGSETIINGTTDWAYEEELGLSDAFRWSPDGKRIAYWRFDQSKIPFYPLMDPLPLYPQINSLRYPKAGEPNSAVQVGVADLTAGDKTTWLDVGTGADQYLARMDWVGNDSVSVQRMPRSQTRVEVLMVSATTGKPRFVMADSDSAYVEMHRGGLEWIDGGHEFVYLSDRSGWRQLFLFNRSGKLVRQLTPDGTDFIEIVGTDERTNSVYVLGAAPTPMERNVYRCALNKAKMCTRITPERGSHSLDIAPGARWAIEVSSDINTPAKAVAVELPSMKVRRTIEDNAKLATAVASLKLRPAEFIKVPMPDGTVLDGYRIAPADFDSTKHYPVLMYVYGGPAAPTVNDAWQGQTYLWFQMLAQRGYVIVSVDNRGAAFRGRDFRKMTEGHLGMIESQDQMDAARWIGRQSWGDPSRIGIWGWSYGGYMTTLTSSRGGSLFRMALAVAPVTDWRLYDSIYTERYMRTPQENPEGYRMSSAQTYADSLRARFLIVHGTGDDNVHPQNTLQEANRLEAAGKVFSMMLYPNRTHSISEGGVTPQLRATLTRFILDNL